MEAISDLHKRTKDRGVTFQVVGLSGDNQRWCKGPVSHLPFVYDTIVFSVPF